MPSIEFHEKCLSNWLHHSISSHESKTCPECRQSVTMTQTRRIYFHLSSVIDDVQSHLEFLDTEITTKNNKLHVATMQLQKLKSECKAKLREKDDEIQNLTGILMNRFDPKRDYEIQKLNAKIEKLKLKMREGRPSRCKQVPYPKVTMGAVQLSMSENMRMPVYHSTEPNAHLSSMRLQSNCDPITALFSTNISNSQAAVPSITVQNPFECDNNTSIRSIRNPLSTFTPGYQSQNGYMNMSQTFGTFRNPMQSAHATQTSQQQPNPTSYTYNQTSFFVPIQATNTLNTTYFGTNDQNHFIGQLEMHKHDQDGSEFTHLRQSVPNHHF